MKIGVEHSWNVQTMKGGVTCDKLCGHKKQLQLSYKKNLFCLGLKMILQGKDVSFLLHVCCLISSLFIGLPHIFKGKHRDTKRPSEDVQFERLGGVCVVVLCCALFCPAGADWRAISCMSYTWAQCAQIWKLLISLIPLLASYSLSPVMEIEELNKRRSLNEMRRPRLGAAAI